MSQFLSDVFYSLGLLGVLYEMYVMSNPKRVHNFITNLKGVDVELQTTTQKAYGFFQMGYMVWAMVGMLSEQWVVFLLLLVVSVIPFRHLKAFGRFFDAVISLCVVLFLVLNHFHFKINVTDFAWSLFN